MRNRILTGIFAAFAGALLPLLLLGNTPGKARETDMPPVVTVAPPEQVVPEDSERTVQAIVIHESAEESLDETMPLTVNIAGEDKTLTLREYLVGVVMGEMPASFSIEALKAQTVAARTYTLRRLEGGGTLSDDPGVCQAYTDPATAEEKWGEGWQENLEKILTAVEETDGQVLTYDGELISATYFSCSGGKTESAQAVWGGEVPYLISVESPGEEEASAFESVVTVPLEEFLAALEIDNPAVSAVTYTDGGGVDSITIDGRTISGTDMRERFGLRSTLFRMETDRENVTFYVQGFGHRVGMSQYGAQAMAEAGSTYQEILRWYYTGVEIGEYAGV